jgi:hypothetical protein
MTQPNDSFASNPALAQSALGRSSFFALFGTQTIGAIFLICTGLLVYREVLADPVSHETHPWAIVGSLSSIALMQICYWVSYRVRPPLPQFQNALLGHAILFLARMIYVLPTSIFGFVFIAQRPEFEIPVYQCLVLLLGLFALFCYVRELERLGRVFIDREKRPSRTARRQSLHATRTVRRMMGWTAPRTASVCQDGRCQNPI